MNKTIKQDRIYFFDAMRSMLIIFIVIIHALQVFNPSASWLVHNSNDLYVSPFIINFLLLFTLQSFFIMSGYLTAMSINKLGAKKFFDSRIKRIFIPIIVTALTFNSLQAYILTQFNGNDITLHTYLVEGKWISHLWFLIDLAIFFILTYIATTLFESTIKKINHFFNLVFEKTGVHTILLIISFIILTLVILFSILSPYLYNKIINIKSIFFYFPFFILGILLFNNQKFFHRFIHMPIGTTLLITTLFTYLSIYFLKSTNSIEKIAYYFFNASSNVFASALCFILFYKFFNKKSKLFSFLADSSYSIYLFHHLFIIVGGIIFIKLNIGGYIGFLMLLLFAISISLLIHYFIISKSNLLAFLFNGKKLKGKQ